MIEQVPAATANKALGNTILPWAAEAGALNCIRCVLLPRGGTAPTARRRSDGALSLAEREDISRGIASSSSIRTIAGGLDRAASTVSRKVTRHGGRSAYRALDADKQAWKSALRPKKCLLARNPKLRGDGCG